MRRMVAVLLALGWVLAACTAGESAGPSGGSDGGSATGSAAASPSAPTAEASSAAVLSLSPLDVEPVERRDESVALAFDRESATSLLEALPADLDFGESVVVCVFLGPRQTTGWSLDLRSAALRGGELHILARETAPRGTTRPVVTYPADCGLLTRAALPVGELLVRADDTITGEFIADTSVVVPAAPTTP